MRERICQWEERGRCTSEEKKVRIVLLLCSRSVVFFLKRLDLIFNFKMIDRSGRKSRMEPCVGKVLIIKALLAGLFLSRLVRKMQDDMADFAFFLFFF